MHVINLTCEQEKKETRKEPREKRKSWQRKNSTFNTSRVKMLWNRVHIWLLILNKYLNCLVSKISSVWPLGFHTGIFLFHWHEKLRTFISLHNHSLVTLLFFFHWLLFNTPFLSTWLFDTAGVFLAPLTQEKQQYANDASVWAVNKWF